MDELGKCVLEHFSSQKEEMVAFLRKLVQAESPSTSRCAQAQVLSILLEALMELGYSVEIYEGNKTGGYLQARPAESWYNENVQLLLGHCDTVWPLKTLEKMPFLVEDGIVKGPGVFDMKGGLTQMIFSLKAIKMLRLKPALAPVVLINSDEEIGSIESRGSICKLAQQAQRSYVLEPAVGEGGKVKTARKGVGRFEVTVNGRAAHAGLEPQNGVSAILELTYQVQKLFALNDLERGITVNVGMIEGGLRPNAIAPQSRVLVDVRVPTMEDAREIEAAILKLEPLDPGTTLHVKVGRGRLPMERNSRNHQLWSLAQEQGRKMELDLEECMSGGASDANITSQYCATLDGLGAVGGGAHAEHEFIYIDKMVERSALLVLLLMAPSYLDLDSVSSTEIAESDYRINVG